MPEEQGNGLMKVVVLDLFDAYHYADVFDDWRYKVITDNFSNFDKAKELADRLFWALNPEAKTQPEWYKWDAGFDVHVYDAKGKMLYRAHEKLPKE